MVELLLVMGLIATGSLLSGLFGDDEDDAADTSSNPEEPGLQLRGGPEDDLLTGGAGDDSMVGNLGNDTLNAGDGDDLLLGRSGSDLLSGEGGNDSLFGENGSDQLSGGEGDDLLDGGAGVDLLIGGLGNDVLRGEQDDDALEGGLGSDSLLGGAGDDVLIGYTRSDGAAISGTADPVFGDADTVDPDTLDGGDGEDLLVIGRGDTAFGGAGEDVFTTGIWMDASADTGIIADFEPTGEEILILVPETYTGAGAVTIVDEGADALVQMDGQTYARVTGAAATLTPAMVSVVFTPFVLAA